ncbi:GH39 family glycosyl hydrolase [Pontibacter sp. G13]|uniref:GH39 family glycosyl hydrolase n=1 Tax=Pontibacter sp. G13 TaxID=3074898 RepID=UPI002889B699|nr:cellulase family glycosylhydrolase [Pontibacter sp. G13]WNJ20648.1 T9SS type A sorting domain-containing protein [Pontibacter sp. G13]
MKNLLRTIGVARATFYGLPSTHKPAKILKQRAWYLAILCVLGMAQVSAQTTVTVKFDEPAYYPLLKDKGSVFLESYPNQGSLSVEESMDMLAPLEVGAFRILSRQGGTNHVDTLNGEVVVNRVDRLNSFISSALQYKVEPVLTLFQTPDYLLPPDAPNSKAAPTDMVEYGRAMAAYTAQFVDTKPLMWEIWNEPQSTEFLISDDVIGDYNEIYRQVVPRVRSVDPDAVIVGPAMANNGPRLAFTQAFVQNLKDNDLPIDYYSIHSYGNSGTRLQDLIDLTREELSDDFQTVPLVFTEYEYYPAGNNQPSQANRILTIGAANWLNDMSYFIEQTDIPYITWNRWMEKPGNNPGGLFFSDLRKRPIYHTYELYGRMPVERKVLEASNGLKGFASSNAQSAAILIWNDSSSVATIQLDIPTLPFANGQVSLYRIDAQHASIEENSLDDELEAEWIQALSTLDQTVLTIPGPGIIFLEITPDTPTIELPPLSSGQYIRQWAWAGRTTSGGITGDYGNFHWRSMTGRIGVKDSSGRGIAGVTLDDCPEKIGFQFWLQHAPTSATLPHSIAAIRIDYMNGDSALKSVMLHGDTFYDPARTSTLPWGKGGAFADYMINLGDTIGNDKAFVFDIADHQPAGWNADRRVLVSFWIENTGVESQARIRMLQVGGDGSTYIIHKASGQKLHNNFDEMGNQVNLEDPVQTDADVRWKLIPIPEDSGYYRIEHQGSTRWFHCQEDGVTAFRLGPLSWTGERTKWSIIPVDSLHFRLAHKASGLWLYAEPEGTGLKLASPAYTDDRTQWSFEEILFDQTTSTQPVHASNLISAWPNPITSDQLKISGTQRGDHLLVMDLHGRNVYSGIGTGEELELDTRTWGKGIFLLQVSSGENMSTLKLIIP